MMHLLWIFVIISDNVQVFSMMPPQIAHRSRNNRSDAVVRDGSWRQSTTPTTNSYLADAAPSQLDYRLSRLERAFAERLESLRIDIKETNRRLQALEWQGADAHAKIDNIKNDLSTLSSADGKKSCELDQAKLQTKTENLSKGIQLLVANMRSLNVDIGAIRSNLSFLADNTRELRQTPEGSQLSEDIASYHQLSKKDFPKNCNEIVSRGYKVSKIYNVKPDGTNSTFLVMCDMETMGGGWTVIHNRFDGSEEFYRDWEEYKRGFGNLGGEFWLGLENIYLLTGNEVNELLVELEDLEHRRTQAHYETFSVGPEERGYPLHVLEGYKGDAGDSLIYHAGSKFSARDKDQDGWIEGNCAQAHGGAWWYRGCDTANLNGRYLKGELPDQYIYQGMYWAGFKGPKYSLLKARMLIRPKNDESEIRNLRSAISPRNI
ncbi:techylectin-5B-like [Agrilus planipennis]|uniref:Techylectin-5B-like n=1 Tax=Agrilus planipennis TaxID=224129 RepID=A0A1W4WIT3_AGRPL|nr:techylectin-5B-like [Agrilus planipennis]